MLSTFIAIVAVIVLWTISTQRKLDVLDENISNAMSQIWVQLSSRFDALTALLDLTKGYAKHESETLIQTIKSRRSVITAKSTPNVVQSPTLEIIGGTISNNAPDGRAITFSIENIGTFKIPSGSPVIKGGGWAVNKAPNLSSYTNVQISASTANTQGNDATVITKETLDSSLSTYKYLKFEQATTPSALTGAATISNTAPRIRDRLIGSLVGGNNTGALTYVWKTNGTQVGIGSDYIVAAADLGKAITLEITSSVQTGTVTSTAKTAVAKKSAPAAPAAPTLLPKTHNSVTLTANADYEFSKDDSTWQKGNVFSGLTASTAYTFYQRVAEIGDTEASAASTKLDVTTSSNGGGGGSSSDKNRPVIVTPPALDKPNSPTQGEIKVSGKVNSKGNITVNITDKIVVDVFDKALAEAKKNGNDQNGITVVFRVDTGSKTGSNVTVNLPKTVQETIIAKKIVNTIVVVDNLDIRIGMDLATVQEINKQAKSDVNITAARMDSSKLTGDGKKAIDSRPVFDLKVNYGSGKQVQNFGAGSVSVTIPYTLGANEKAGNVQAAYVDDNGMVHWIVSSVYDSINKVLRFGTSHLSTYGVGYKQDAPLLTDISTHWAKDDIQFVVNRGLLTGTTSTTFSPNTAMTRGMFVTALGRLANADVSSYKHSTFTDVKSDTYYMGYIEWANKNSIVNGTGNGKFAPDQSITREQIAIIMQNYAIVLGFIIPKVHEENIFADSAKISTYAKDAVKQMQMVGVISGKNCNLFDPQGTATRAEVSAVLRRFVELTISNDTMQGWTMNDSGKWMYYENGKYATGKKEIDGLIYTFDQYGVKADVPKNLKYTPYTVLWLIARKLGCSISELERINYKSRLDLIHPGDVIQKHSK